jgi:uncharacterized protein involved in tolerance to divalent cations
MARFVCVLPRDGTFLEFLTFSVSAFHPSSAFASPGEQHRNLTLATNQPSLFCGATIMWPFSSRQLRNRQKKSHRNNYHRRRRMLFEGLENRQMLAGGLAASLAANGVLSIAGTDLADTIVVRQINNRVLIDGLSTSYAVSQVNRIVVDARGGNDTVDLNSAAVSGQQPITIPATIYGGDGDDFLDGGAGNDELIGGNDTGQRFGSWGDILYGRAGNDYLDGGLGKNAIIGGDGDDILVVGGTGNWADGGSGSDTLMASVAGQVVLTNSSLTALASFTAMENAVLTGGSGNDTIDASTFSLGWVSLHGGLGNDVLIGGSGSDELYGEGGDDVLYGRLGSDSLWGGDGNDTLNGDQGNDRLFGENGDDFLDGGAGNDELIGGNDTGRRFGSWGDILYGRAGNDYLDGGLGKNAMIGGDGDDILVVGGTGNWADGGSGSDTLMASVATLAATGLFSEAEIRCLKQARFHLPEATRRSAMTEAIQISTTTATKADAEKIASALVERQLAACVQVGGPITSCYRWQGQVETAEEWLCTIKTTAEAYQRVEQAIRELHPYQEPEIIAVPIVAGSPGYLAWLADQIEHGG